MTKMDNPFHNFIQDLFADMGRIRIRKMFGGAGVYSGEDMFALIDKERLYVKADDTLKSDLEAQGGKPFIWTNPDTGRTMTMSYVSLPADALGDVELASHWGRQALAVTVRTRKARVKSPRRTPF